jgi:serine/threonine protein kinase
MKIDNYDLETCLGKGAFGEVYLTSRKGDPKKYATKKLDREEIESGEGIKYLRNEIVILQYLNHPNIVKFQEVKKTKHHYYIIMEYCNGGELSKALEKYVNKYGKPFPEELVQHFMRQIISAFKYIHERKIIHRDVKLDNILLHFENEEDLKNFDLMKATVKIIDFGFACKISKTGLQYTVLGSPINMDPIILKKLNSSTKKTKQLGYSEKADIWSIGTICYEMVIGRPVYDAEDMDDLVEKVEDGSYKVPTSMSHELVSFLNAMLQYNSEHRLTASQLSRHDFIVKDVKDFKKIDLEKVAGKVKGDKLGINSIKNKTIWSIFNADSQNLLTSIVGSKFIKPIDEKEELEFEKNKKIALELPCNGIPDNPTEQKITGMTKDEIDQFGKESVI